MTVPEELRGLEWTSTVARKMIPLLVWCAQNGVKISYSQIDAELQRRGWSHHVHAAAYGYPAGRIGDVCESLEQQLGERVPPLNALLVSKGSGVPGSGCDYYLATYLGKPTQERLSFAQRSAMAEETMEEVWRFQKWDKVLKILNLAPVAAAIPGLTSGRSRRPPRKVGWSGGPETPEHKALKEWVAENPSLLGGEIPYRRGQPEWIFASADRADVMFEHIDGCMAVEVKAANANDADLERGIYQCIKYRALLRAELKAQGRVPNGSSIMVTERQLPSDLQELAGLLGVRVVVVPVLRGAT